MPVPLLRSSLVRAVSFRMSRVSRVVSEDSPLAVSSVEVVVLEVVVVLSQLRTSSVTSSCGASAIEWCSGPATVAEDFHCALG